jgi:NADPH:quinone reductase-like Zn-dependent oxidoreductase
LTYCTNSLEQLCQEKSLAESEAFSRSGYTGHHQRLLDHFQVVGRDLNLAVFFGDISGDLDGVVHVRDQLGVVIRGETASDPVHLAVCRQEGHRFAALRAIDRALVHLSGLLVIAFLTHFFQGASFVNDLAFHRHRLRPGRRGQHGDECRGRDGSKELSHWKSSGTNYTPRTMRQIVISRYGAPDVLVAHEGPSRPPAAGEVRIAVRAAGVNFADVLARVGLYPDAPKLPLVVGYEVAGTVDAVGAGVTRLAVGDRVVALTRFGGYATEVVVQEAFVFPFPADLSDAEAAALPVNYLTALIALYRMANVVAEETVLIHGAGGGVGIAAIQLARLRRATVIGTASASKHAALRSFGVEHLVDYRTTDVAREVRRITGHRGVDVVLDPVGGRSFTTSYGLLAPLGRLVMFGVSSISRGERRNWLHAARAMMQMPRFKPLSLINHNRGIFGLNLAHLWDERGQLAAAMQFLLEEVGANRLAPVIAKTFPLERASDAHRYMQGRGNIGKIVLTV